METAPLLDTLKDMPRRVNAIAGEAFMPLGLCLCEEPLHRQPGDLSVHNPHWTDLSWAKMFPDWADVTGEDWMGCKA